jgi:phosphorylcholine metabolism protein LicD
VVKYNLDFIPFYGTLLGIIRDNDFIDEDDDIDILVHFDDYTKILKMIKEDKLKTRKINEKIIQLFHPSGIGPIDIYFYHKFGEDILIKWDGNLLYSQKYIFPLKNIIFKNEHIIPFDSNEILKQTYGKNYLTPIKKHEYNWYKIHNVRRKKKNKLSLRPIFKRLVSIVRKITFIS